MNYLLMSNNSDALDLEDELFEHYRSDMANNTSSSVQITDITYFGLNSAGKNVYKVSGIIDCKERKVGTSIDANLSVNFVFGIEIP